MKNEGSTNRSTPNSLRIGLIAFVSALIGGVVALLLFGNLAGWSQLWTLGEVRWQKLTEQDAENLKRLATGLEEFAVDHSGSYPASLDQVGPPYLAAKVFIPGSNPAQPYTYHYPAVDPRWGKYDLVDDGSFDPSVLNLANGIGGAPCSKMTCRYIIYAGSIGLIGSPTALMSIATGSGSVVPIATAEPIPVLYKQFLYGAYTFQQRTQDITSLDGLTNGWTEVLAPLQVSFTSNMW